MLLDCTCASHLKDLYCSACVYIRNAGKLQCEALQVEGLDPAFLQPCYAGDGLGASGEMRSEGPHVLAQRRHLALQIGIAQLHGVTGYEGVAGFAEVTDADAAALCDTGAGSLANDLPEAWLHPDALPRNTATRRATMSLRPELFEQDQT